MEYDFGSSDLLMGRRLSRTLLASDHPLTRPGRTGLGRLQKVIRPAGSEGLISRRGAERNSDYLNVEWASTKNMQDPHTVTSQPWILENREDQVTGIGKWQCVNPSGRHPRIEGLHVIIYPSKKQPYSPCTSSQGRLSRPMTVNVSVYQGPGDHNFGFHP